MTQFYSRNNCPCCGSKAFINERRPTDKQVKEGTEFSVFQVQCFTGCKFSGPEHIYMVGMTQERGGLNHNYHATPEKARKEAMAAWNTIAGLCRGKV